MTKRLCSSSLILIAGLSFYGCQERRIDKETSMDVVEKPWPVWAVTFSPHGSFLAAGRGYRSEAGYWMGGKGEVNLWKVEDWRLKNGFPAPLNPFTTYVQALAFMPDGKHLIAAATQYIQKAPSGWGPFAGAPNPHDGNAIFVGAVPDGYLDMIHHFNEPGDKRGAGFVSCLDIHPDGELIGLSGAGSSTVVLNWKTGHIVYEVRGNGRGQDLVFSPDGKTLALALESSVQLCDAGTGKELATLEPSFEAHRPTCVRYSGDGKQIAVGISNGSVRLLSADLTKELRTLQISSDKEWVVGIASVPKPDLLAAATPSSVRLFEASTGKQLREWGKADLRISSVALSPDGKLLAVGYCGKHDAKGEFRGGYVNIWDTATGRLVKKLD